MSGAGVPISDSRHRLRIAGWLLVAVSLAYAGLIHHGVGATGQGAIQHWWQPRGLFFTYEAFDSLLSQPGLATFVFVLPALILFVAVVLLTRSAVASMLSLAAVGMVLLCCFYGLGGNRRAVWTFFGWRGSAVMALFSLAIAAALVAPALARSWLARGWPARLVLYLPIAIAVMIVIRDITGTDPALSFAISPWPVLSMFGIEIGAAAIAALLGMLGLDLAAIALILQRRVVPGVLCALLSAAIPLLALPPSVLGVSLGLGSGLLALVTSAAALVLVLLRDSDPATSRAPVAVLTARPLALGAALVAIPILSGQLLVDHDYDATRNERAKTILDALDRYYARESVYPDTLADLVQSKDLDRIPAPQIGFGVFESPQFTYQNFGTNYLLEFSAPRWVQCAYNPPYADEEGGSSLGAVDGTKTASSTDPAPGETRDPAPGDAGEGAAEPTPGSWTCPQKPPDLW